MQVRRTRTHILKRELLNLGLSTTESSFSGDPNFWDELLDVVAAHLKREGPDWDAAQFMSLVSAHVWARHTEMIKLATPYLSNINPDRVAATIEVFY